MSRRTLWEEGRMPPRQVASLSGVAALLAIALSLVATRELGYLFDVAFVVICVAAALAVRPRDFFVVGVMPPLLMLGAVSVLAVAARGAVADPNDGLVQAAVSGLAHHSGALVVGYAFTLATLALRQLATQQRLPAQAARRRTYESQLAATKD